MRGFILIDLDKVFGSRVFVIPSNQRGYSWTKKEIDDLFGDLSLMGTKCHYLGTVICTKTDNFMDEKTQRPTFRYTLEDGQQRLTTFLILIDAIRRRFEDIDQGETIDSQKLKELMTYKCGAIGLRIENKNKSLHECLTHFLLGTPSALPADFSPSMRYMENAVNYIRAKINERDTRESLIDIRNKVCHQIQIIDVDLSDALVDRYLTFDAINSRGLPLTEFDKIKNFCILVSERRGLNIKADELWYQSVINLEKYDVASRGNENSFIADLYSVFHGVSTSNSDVHDTFVKEYRTLLEGENKLKENQLISFVGYWVEYANAWGFISSRHKTKYYGSLITKDAGRWLDSIDNLGLPGVTKKVLSVSLMLSLNLGDNFSAVARACEIYTFRMHAICRYRVDKNSKAILELANSVLRNQKGSDYTIKGLSDLLNSNARLDTCISQLLSGDLNYKTWRNYLYYMLYEYELSESSAGVKPLNWASSDDEKDNSIEHILPQEHRDAGWWEKHWPDASLADKFSHRIGNLVLTQGNSILGRKPIDKKIKDPDADYYYNHRKATNSEKLIQKYTDGSIWKEVNILSRELDIIKFAANRWAMPSVVDDVKISLPEIFPHYVPGCSMMEFKSYDYVDPESNEFETIVID
ncbi:DUF262 domain-containing protein [Aeromonas veronii]|uniref:DUF262 domain-containing protein n=1 Tax=Aeromonas veronii TaxID=654 RepID=UPI002A74B9DA|nr:DUF262 domain-containing protein [Aeromonas veronii]